MPYSDFLFFSRFHFEALAHDNDAQSSVADAVKGPESVPAANPPTQPLATVLRGTQLVRKFNRPTADEVRILLALFRVDDKEVDIVLSVNIPAINHDGTVLNPAAFAEANEAFYKAVQTFKILDFDLFA
jgi:hypothetical protein